MLLLALYSSFSVVSDVPEDLLMVTYVLLGMNSKYFNIHIVTVVEDLAEGWTTFNKFQTQA